MLISFSYSNLKNFEFQFHSFTFEFQKLGLGFSFGLWLNSLQFRDPSVVIKLSILTLGLLRSFDAFHSNSPLPLFTISILSIFPVESEDAQFGCSSFWVTFCSWSCLLLLFVLFWISLQVQFRVSFVNIWLRCLELHYALLDSVNPFPVVQLFLLG